MLFHLAGYQQTLCGAVVPYNILLCSAQLLNCIFKVFFPHLGILHPKHENSVIVYLLTLKLLQTCMSFFSYSTKTNEYA